MFLALLHGWWKQNTVQGQTSALPTGSAVRIFWGVRKIFQAAWTLLNEHICLPELPTRSHPSHSWRDGLNVCVLGPSDSGKSYLAKAIGIVACAKHRVGYFHCEDLLESLVVQKAKDYTKYQKRLKKTCGLDLLILDDFLLHTLTDEREVKLLFEILEKRSEMKLSTFICSQRDPKSWSAMILNDEVSANAILKRATKHFTVLIRPKSAT